MATPDRATLGAIVARIERRLAAGGTRPLVVGLCGAQGSGKSTIADALAQHFTDRGLPTAILSLDDLYHTLRAREALADRVHPLLLTRGVPGTHDVALGLSILADIARGAPTPLPRFDKATDDRAPRDRWDLAPADTALMVFEGWCVGARPQGPADLAPAVNTLEREEDGDGAWRRFVNTALAGSYQTLFGWIDLLVLLAAPDFGAVSGWRIEQEHALRDRTGRGMTDEQVIRFVQHYERITRHIMAEMPARADLVVRLDARRAAIATGMPAGAAE
jgi:D-glycerate 3-kinase